MLKATTFPKGGHRQCPPAVGHLIPALPSPSHCFLPPSLSPFKAGFPGKTRMGNTQTACDMTTRRRALHYWSQNWIPVSIVYSFVVMGRKSCCSVIRPLLAASPLLGPTRIMQRCFHVAREAYKQHYYTATPPKLKPCSEPQSLPQAACFASDLFLLPKSAVQGTD